MGKKDYKIRIEKTEIDIPYKDGKITFIYPSFGPENYKNVGSAILGNNLLISTAEQSVSLLHAVYCSPKEFTNQNEIKNIRNIMKQRWIWNFNLNVWTKEGVYVLQDLEAKGLEDNFSVDALEGILKDGKELLNGVKISGDEKIRFASRDSYKLGEHTSESLAQDGFIITSYGENGAKQLSEISKKFSSSSITWGVEVNDNNFIKRVSALNVCNHRLYIDGNYFSGNVNSHAFGVLK